jgi:hypothetical protein
MAATVATGFYAICFPNPIGTSGGNAYTSGSNTLFDQKSALLPQSCLGLSLTVTYSATTVTNSSTVAYYRPAAAAPTSTIATA